MELFSFGEFPRFFKIFPWEYNDTCRSTGRVEQVRRMCFQRWFSDCVSLWHISGYSVFCQGCEKTIHHKLKVFSTRKSLGMEIQWITQWDLWLDNSDGSLIGCIHIGVLYSFFLLSVYLNFIFFFKRKYINLWESGNCKIIIAEKNCRYSNCCRNIFSSKEITYTSAKKVVFKGS